MNELTSKRVQRDQLNCLQPALNLETLMDPQDGKTTPPDCSHNVLSLFCLLGGGPWVPWESQNGRLVRAGCSVWPTGLWVQFLPGTVGAAFLPGLPHSSGSLPLLEPYLAIYLHRATSFLLDAFVQTVPSAKTLFFLTQQPTPAGPSRPFRDVLPEACPEHLCFSPTPASPDQGYPKCGPHCLSMNCVQNKLWMEIVSKLQKHL